MHFHASLNARNQQDEWHKKTQSLTRSERDHKIFQLLKQMRVHQDSVTGLGLICTLIFICVQTAGYKKCCIRNATLIKPNPGQDGVVRKRGPGWKFFGLEMCFSAFLATSGISKRKCQKFLAAIQAGHAEPPEDGRSLRTDRDVAKRDHARVYFQFLYDHMAEPLAEGDQPEESDIQEFTDEFAYWVQGQAESAENPVACASGALESGLPQKCFA